MGLGQYLQREFVYKPAQLHVLSLGRYSNNCLNSLLSGTVGITTNSSWPANNRAQYHPINIPSYFTVARFFVGNADNATGNMDVGLYNGAGTRLLSTGSTARSGTSVVQYIDVTNTTFPPGHYYLGLVLSSSSGTVLRTSEAFVDAAGILQESLGSTTLPTTMTPTVVATPKACWLYGFTQSDTL
jgi:hypothetical protein